MVSTATDQGSKVVIHDDSCPLVVAAVQQAARAGVHGMRVSPGTWQQLQAWLAAHPQEQARAWHTGRTRLLLWQGVRVWCRTTLPPPCPHLARQRDVLLGRAMAWAALVVLVYSAHLHGWPL